MGDVALSLIAWLLLIAVPVALVFLAIKRTRLFLVLIGIAAILGAIPVGFFAELGINGCCGAPTSGREGMGFFLGVMTGLAGMGLLAWGIRFKKKQPGRK